MTWEVIKEAVFPLLLYGMFTLIALRGAAVSIRWLQRFRRQGEIYGARVLGCEQRKVPKGRWMVDLYLVTVDCGGQIMTLSTEHRRGKRYKNLDFCQVCFLPGEGGGWFLEEELRLMRRTRLLGLLGGAICLLFTLLMLMALIMYSGYPFNTPP